MPSPKVHVETSDNLSWYQNLPTLIVKIINLVDQRMQSALTVFSYCLWILLPGHLALGAVILCVCLSLDHIACRETSNQTSMFIK